MVLYFSDAFDPVTMMWCRCDADGVPLSPAQNALVDAEKQERIGKAQARTEKYRFNGIKRRCKKKHRERPFLDPPVRE